MSRRDADSSSSAPPSRAVYHGSPCTQPGAVGMRRDTVQQDQDAAGARPRADDTGEILVGPAGVARSVAVSMRMRQVCPSRSRRQPDT